MNGSKRLLENAVGEFTSVWQRNLMKSGQKIQAMSSTADILWEYTEIYQLC